MGTSCLTPATVRNLRCPVLLSRLSSRRLFVLHVVAPADAVSLDAASADAIQLRRVVFPELLAKLDVRSRNLEQVATHLPCDDAAPLSRVLEDTPLLVGLLERPLTDSELACHGL